MKTVSIRTKLFFSALLCLPITSFADDLGIDNPASADVSEPVAEEVSKKDVETPKAKSSASEAEKELKSEDIGSEKEPEGKSIESERVVQEEEAKAEPEIELSQESVVGALELRYKWIKKCYQQLDDVQKEKTPASITASFFIGKFGQVKRLSFKEKLDASSGIQQCFANTLLPKRFPRPKGGKAVRIKFPVKFR